MIKDIICFANTVHDKDCYLIFGISDDLTVTGMIKQRKKQADIIDAISNLMFAGDVYPKIEVTTIYLDDIEIDVLTIFNIENTPIYLKKNYGQIIQGCIYSRVGDKNTQNKGNSDIIDIENLWKKRLGLTKSKLEYIYDHLNNKTEWNEYDGVFYNIYDPELTIEISDDDEASIPAFYSFALTNTHSWYEMLNIRYHETILDSWQLVILDSGKLSIPTPEWGYLIKEKNSLDNKYRYKYFEKDNNRYKIFSFLYDPQNSDNRYALNHLDDVVLFFANKKEREEFEIYIETNKDLLEQEIKNTEIHYSVYLKDGLNKDVYIQDLRVGCALTKLLSKWRTK